TYADRRQALLELWASRADNTEGTMVAAVVAEFLRQEVQDSAHPITTAELAAANARAAPVRFLNLDESGQAMPPPAPTDPPASEPHNEAGDDPG
ncbi:MAG: hypothetical protein GXP62_19550, partial [Oligoflexia bacterium]|nr:hypothetical protein [Oligoflexia bacterium]